jgi:hypothetical protein
VRHVCVYATATADTWANYGTSSSKEHKPTEPRRPSSSAKRSAATSKQRKSLDANPAEPHQLVNAVGTLFGADTRVCDHGFMRYFGVLLAVGLLATAMGGCGSADASAARPGGLRPVYGYSSYNQCRSPCPGHVPALLRRRLRLARLRPGQRCPVTHRHEVRGAFPGALGAGPVFAGTSVVAGHPVGFPYPPPPAGSNALFAGSKWSGFKVLWVSRPSYNGPVLIRGRQLNGPDGVGFGLDLVPFAELQFPPGTRAGAPPTANGWRNWPSTTRIRSPGCYGWQIDGDNFSEVIVIDAVPRR